MRFCSRKRNKIAYGLGGDMRVAGKQCSHVNVDRITRCRQLTHAADGLCGIHRKQKHKRIAEEVELDVKALKTEAKMRNISAEQLVTEKMSKG